jgi:hypothetical protein
MNWLLLDVKWCQKIETILIRKWNLELDKVCLLHNKWFVAMS